VEILVRVFLAGVEGLVRGIDDVHEGLSTAFERLFYSMTEWAFDQPISCIRYDCGAELWAIATMIGATFFLVSVWFERARWGIAIGGSLAVFAVSLGLLQMVPSDMYY